ncbi:MAG: hypothetical protein Q7U54_05750 [Bacteroidales bacterium]|nr:hypothetical protein [Bacteroidales bacterium]
MIKNPALITLFVLLSVCLSAQKGKLFTVTAGSRIEDCIPFGERYRFPEFTTGKVFFRNGTNTEVKLNYNFLVREMQYIHGKDTLAISNEGDILQVIVADTTFVINKGYVELIYNDKVIVGLRQYFNLLDVRKKDPYGVIGSGSATDSYGSIHSGGQYFKLTMDQDRLFQKSSLYYIATSSGELVPFTKKKVMLLFPANKKAIEDYLKSDKVDFDSRNELLRFAEFLNNM